MKTPKKIIISITTLMLIFGASFFFYNKNARSAVFSFIQTDWSGGASGNTAVYPGDAEGWTEYQTASNVIATGTAGQISLASTSASWLQSETADFIGATLVATAATSGKVILKKPAGVACGSGAECLGGYCDSSGYCSTCEDFTYESQIYEVVMIGEQCWMAENLNVGSTTNSVDIGLPHSDVSNNGIIEKYCYNNTASYCDTEGGLYDWNEAMAYVTTAGSRGICAPGWHIPTDAEWYRLESGLATETCSASRSDWGCSPAGAFLKTNGGTGFEALLAGYRGNTGNFINRGSYAAFWSSSVSGGNAWRRYLSSGESRVYRNAFGKTDGFSVRCLKN